MGAGRVADPCVGTQRGSTLLSTNDFDPAEEAEIVRTVLFIVPTLRGGGAERVMVTLLRHLDPKRYRRILAVVDLRDAVYRAELPSDVELVDLACTRLRKAIPGLLRLVWRFRPDLVFSTLGSLNLVMAALRPAMPRRTAFIGREANTVSEQLKEFPNRALWRLAYRSLYRRFDAVVCQSKYMQRDLVECHGLPIEKTVVIHNPVDLERIRAGLPQQRRIRAPGDPLRLVAAGRLAPAKGFDLLIDAIALLRDVDVRVSILGDGPLRTELEARIARLGLEHAVSLLGFRPDPQRHFAESDALVLSSRYEGLPNVVLEALACGIGVIATPAIGGVAEILDGVAGCAMADEISAPALARAIRSWAATPFPGIAPAALDRFRPPEISEQYARLFERVCERR